MSTTVATQVLDHLPSPQQQQVRALVDRAHSTDRVAALNEQALLGLDTTGTHVLAEADGQVVGYATLADRTAQLVVDPVRRRAGLGTRLADLLADRARAGDTTIRGWWAFGDLPGAAALATRRGLDRVRELLRLERPIANPEPPVTPRPPEGIALRSFVPGQDDRAWLDLNALAFKSHPEQGRMTQDDLDARIAESWFDPAGFLLAVDAATPSRLRGFHWTKAEPGEPVGEVYVLGVDPAASGQGLGAVLLEAGLAHLADRGVQTVELYVEGDNDAALKLYRRARFTTAATDVMYAAAEEARR